MDPQVLARLKAAMSANMEKSTMCGVCVCVCMCVCVCVYIQQMHSGMCVYVRVYQYICGVCVCVVN